MLLVAVSVSVPAPCFTSAPGPLIRVTSTELTALLVVSVAPFRKIVPPVPDSAPTVWLWPLRSMSPPFSASAPFVGSNPPTPIWRTPPLTTVPPV